MVKIVFLFNACFRLCYEKRSVGVFCQSLSQKRLIVNLDALKIEAEEESAKIADVTHETTEHDGKFELIS